jgi:hypothetical protein
MRDGEEPGALADRPGERVEVGRHDDDAGAGAVQRADQPEVLRVGRDDLVAGAEIETVDDHVAAVRRGAVERQVVRRHADLGRHGLPHALARREHRVDVGRAGAPVLEVAPPLRGDRLGRRSRQRARRAGVEVGPALEGRVLAAGFLGRHARTRSTGAWSEKSSPPIRRRSVGQ